MHRYKCWRANGNEDRGDPNGQLHVLCHDGEAFEKLPARFRHLGPWMGSREGPIANLKPHYRLLLAEQGFVVLYSRPARLLPEQAVTTHLGSDARLHQHSTKWATAMAPLHFPAMFQHYRIDTEEFAISRCSGH